MMGFDDFPFTVSYPPIQESHRRVRGRLKPTKTKPMSEKAKQRAKARAWADLRKGA